MKLICHLLLPTSLLLLAACQPLFHGATVAPPDAAAAAAPTQLRPPVRLAAWQMQGSVGQPFGSHSYVYQLASNPTQSLRISIYPRDHKLQGYAASEALKRHGSALALKFKARAASQLHALHTNMLGQQLLRGGVSGLPVINSHFLVNLPNGDRQTTLVSLTLVQDHFVRLTASCASEDAGQLTTHFKQARHQLMSAWFAQARKQAEPSR